MLALADSDCEFVGVDSACVRQIREIQVVVRCGEGDAVDADGGLCGGCGVVICGAHFP